MNWLEKSVGTEMIVGFSFVHRLSSINKKQVRKWMDYAVIQCQF